MERRISPSKRLKSHSVTLGVEEQLHFRPPQSIGTLLYSSTVLIWNSEVAAIRDIASPTSGLKPCPGLENRADYCSSTNQSILKYRNDWCGFEVPGKKERGKERCSVAPLLSEMILCRSAIESAAPTQRGAERKAESTSQLQIDAVAA